MRSQYLVDRDRVLVFSPFQFFYNRSLSFFSLSFSLSLFLSFFHADAYGFEGVAASVHEWIDGRVARECVACEYGILCTFFKVSSFEKGKTFEAKVSSSTRKATRSFVDNRDFHFFFSFPFLFFFPLFLLTSSPHPSVFIVRRGEEYSDLFYADALKLRRKKERVYRIILWVRMFQVNSIPLIRASVIALLFKEVLPTRID